MEGLALNYEERTFLTPDLHSYRRNRTSYMTPEPSGLMVESADVSPHLAYIGRHRRRMNREDRRGKHLLSSRPFRLGAPNIQPLPAAGLTIAPHREANFCLNNRKPKWESNCARTTGANRLLQSAARPIFWPVATDQRGDMSNLSDR